MIHELTRWLAASPASEAVQRIFWLIPVVQTVHLLAIAVLVTSGVLLGLRLLGLAWREQDVAATAQRFLPWVWGSLLALAASGTVLIVGEPARTLGNPAFWAKVVAIVGAVALTASLQRRLRDGDGAWLQPGTTLTTPAARVIGGASVLLWLSALALGRWIAYILEN